MTSTLRLLLLLALALSWLGVPPRATSVDEENAVYGEAGPGRIQVRARIDFERVGLHWLPEGAKLPALLAQAGMITTNKGEFDSPAIIVVFRPRKEGGTEKIRFRSARRDQFVLEARGQEFTLQEGDVVVTAYLI